MNYSDYGLDTNKLAKDPDSHPRKWMCLWGDDAMELGGHHVLNGFNLCFAHFVICRDCVETVDEPEQAHRWIDGECFKCKTSLKPGFSSKRDIPENGLLICSDCIDWAKDTFSKQDDFNNKTRAQMTTEEILSKCTIVDRHVKLPKDILLDHQSEYVPLTKLLKKAGARWIGGNVSAFVFPEDPTEIIQMLIKGETIKTQPKINFSKQESPAEVQNTTTPMEELALNTQEPDMSFFIQLAALLGQAEISLSIKPKDGQLTVMVMPKGADVKTPGMPTIKPMFLTGTPEELDAEFFSEVAGPLEKTAGLFSNAAEYEKSLNKSIEKTAATEADKPARKTKAKADTETPAPEESNQNPAEEVKSETIQPEVSQEDLDKIAADKRKEEFDQKANEAQKLVNQGDYTGAMVIYGQIKDQVSEYPGEAEALETNVKFCQEAIDKEAKYKLLTGKSDEFAGLEDWKNAAGALKQAKNYSSDPESLDEKIKEYIQKGLEAEMANQSESYI